MSRVLFLTKFVPSGQAFGGMTRTVRLLEALRERFDVEVVGFAQQGAPAIRGRVSSLLTGLATRRSYQMVRYDTPSLRREVARQLQIFQPDAVHVDYLQLADAAWDIDLPKLPMEDVDYNRQWDELRQVTNRQVICWLLHSHWAAQGFIASNPDVFHGYKLREKEPFSFKIQAYYGATVSGSTKTYTQLRFV